MAFSFGKAVTFVAIAGLQLSMSGCLSGGGKGDGEAADNGSTGANPTTNQNNSAPTISGNPSPAVAVGGTYRFTPSANDPDGDALSFRVDNLPPWATFNPADGSISGRASAGTEGTYRKIRVSVTDGQHTVSTRRFSVTVVQDAMGSITLSWQATTLNDDGTPLVDLSGYRIYYGTESGIYDNTVEIDNPGVTTYVIENLVDDTYYMAATSVNSENVESSFSNEIVRIVN